METPPPEIAAKLIEDALSDILASSVFQSSKQCQILLRYVVDFSFAEQDELLRERVIGATVFGRSPDYDTGNDPVVRARVAEVRKRLAQYYFDHPDKAAVQISIPKGAYRVVFSYSLPSPDAEWSDGVSEKRERTADFPEPPAPTINGSVATPEKGPDKPIGRRYPLKSWTSLIALLIVITVTGGSLMLRSWHNQTRVTPFMQFWAPLSSNSKPVVIYIGANASYRLSRNYLENYKRQHQLQNPGLDFFIDLQPSESIPESDLVPTDKLIGFGDVAAASRMTSMLAKLGRKYDLRYGNDINITDLESSPVILIGGFSNAWAMQITRHLRYTLEQGDRVVDNHDKSKTWQWKGDEANGQGDDYAVLSRLVRSPTGSFVLSIAGVASSSNQATADFVSDPRQIEKLLQTAPPGWENMNMQVVLHTKTINDIPTSVDVQAIYFW
ncbi:MAG: hypothetical protein ACRD3F_11540 [Acidobacteriaceae bacterium]